MRFEQCQGKYTCHDDGVYCLRCGRSLVEIATLRSLLDQLAGLALAYDYENVEDYTAYIAHKLPNMIAHRRQQITESKHAD
jgi:hypothetical protein